jgi:hypothetical protein
MGAVPDYTSPQCDRGNRGCPLQPKHSFLRRLNWNPIVVAVPFAYLVYTTVLAGFPLARTAGAAFVTLWFGLSVYDSLSHHRLLDWLYSDEQVPSEDATPD